MIRFSSDFPRVPDGDPAGWERVSAETQLDGKYLHVEDVRYRTPTRDTPVTWTVVHRKSAIAVIAITEDEKVLMVRQERIPPRLETWEVVAGQIDETDRAHDAEIIRETIVRELAEEAGYEIADGGEILSLGYYYTSPGFTDEHIYLFLARPVVPLPSGNEPDDSEAILDIRTFTIDELRTMIPDNVIVDSLTLAIFARLTARNLI